MEIRKKVILRLIECLTPTASFDIFMDNHFTSFRLLTHLKIRATRVLVTQMRYHWEQTAAKKKKNMAILNSAHLAKSSVTLVVVD